MPLLNNTDFDSLFLQNKILFNLLVDVSFLAGKTAVKNTKIYLVNQNKDQSSPFLIDTLQLTINVNSYSFESNKNLIIDLQKNDIITTINFQSAFPLYGYYNQSDFI